MSFVDNIGYPRMFWENSNDLKLNSVALPTIKIHSNAIMSQAVYLKLTTYLII